MASPVVIPISSTKFQLDKTIVAPNGSLTIDIGATTAHDVLDAILENKPFPNRKRKRARHSLSMPGRQRLDFRPRRISRRAWAYSMPPPTRSPLFSWPMVRS